MRDLLCLLEPLTTAELIISENKKKTNSADMTDFYHLTEEGKSEWLYFPLILFVILKSSFDHVRWFYLMLYATCGNLERGRYFLF